MLLLCHLEADICILTVFMVPIIAHLMGINPSNKFVQILDISFFLTNRYNQKLKSTKKPFEAICENLRYLMTGLLGNFIKRAKCSMQL